MKCYVIFPLIEDQRRTLQTIKLRRSRLAKVLRGALAARRSARQTLGQMRKAGKSAETDPSPKRGMNRLATLNQRHTNLMKKYAKHRISAGRSSGGSLDYALARKYRAASDTPIRPANPKTYGRGEKSGSSMRKKPFKIWRDAP